ncbi:MAG: hypothetical protein HGB19_10115 [Chlorobiales bacterium]|nr:hypothetical protein [Chlorobiales bacterium]
MRKTFSILAEWGRQNQAVIRFCLLFVLYVACFIILVELEWMKTVFIPGLAEVLAKTAYRILNQTGMNAALSGVIVFQRKGFAVEITNTCSGIIQVYFLLAAVLAFPANRTDKLIGASLGSVLLLVVNLFRIVGLFFVGVYARPWFDFVHGVLGEIGMIVATFLIWFGWAKAARRRTVSSQALYT